MTMVAMAREWLFLFPAPRPGDAVPPDYGLRRVEVALSLHDIPLYSTILFYNVDYCTLLYCTMLSETIL